MSSKIIEYIFPEQSEFLTTENGAFTKSELYKFTAPLEANEAIKIKTNDFTFTWKPTELCYKDENETYDYIVDSAPSKLLVFGKQARYLRTTAFSDDVFYVQNDKVKHWTILNEKPRSYAEYLSGKVYFGVSGIVNGMPLLDGIYSEIELENYKLPKPIIKDLTGNEIEGFYEVVNTDIGQQLFIWFDADFLNDAVYPIMIDPTVVVANTYTTCSTAKPQTLSNGWIVACVDEGTNYLKYYVSKDTGATFTPLCFWTNRSTTFAMCSFGTMVYCMSLPYAMSATFSSFDASIIENVDINSYRKDIDVQSMDYIGVGCSLAINSIGTVIGASWTSKTSTYTTSFCLRYAQTIDGGATFTNQAGGAGVNNVSINDCYAPYVLFDKNNVVGIFNTRVVSGNTYTEVWRNALGFSLSNILPGLAYTQINSNAVLKKNGANIGRIWYVFQGKDATDTTYYNIKVSYSDDNMATWSTPVKITSGNTVNRQTPTLSEKPNGDIICMYNDNGVISYQTCANGGTAFTGLTTIGTGTIPSIQNYVASGIIGYIWKTASNIQFDKFTYNTAPTAPTGLTLPVFDATIGGTLTWTFNDPDAGNTQSAYQVIIIRVSDSAVMKDTGKVASTVTSYTIPANILANAIAYQIKVICWDNLDVIGLYSSLKAFTPYASPTCTITFPVTNGDTYTGSLITSTWSFSDPVSLGQSAYQLRLTNGSDLELWNSGKVNSISARSLTIGYTLLNTTTYKIKLKVWNGADVVSSEIVRTFVTSFITPATPIITHTDDNIRGSITINITNPTPTGGRPTIVYNDIYRKKTGEVNYIRIATGIANNGNYIDYTPASGQLYDYKIRAIGSNNTSSDSMSITSSITIQNTQLSLILDSSKYIKLLYSPSKGQKIVIESTLTEFAGREKPITEFGEHTSNEVGSSFEILEQVDLEMLQFLIYSRQSLLYRDSRGRRIYCTISSLDIKDNLSNSWIVSFTPSEISYNEVV